MPTDASTNKRQKTHQPIVFDDGAATKVGLGKKYADGSMLLTDDIYGGKIPEESKIKLFKYNVTDLDEEEEKLTLAYSAQAIKENEFIWIDFPNDKSLMHYVSIEMSKQGHEKYLNAMGRIKGGK